MFTFKLSNHFFSLFVLLFTLASCHWYNRKKDEFSYKSITGRKGKLKTTLGGQIVEYKNITVTYSETNSSTVLITTQEGKDIYIQGPAVIEFQELDEIEIAK